MALMITTLTYDSLGAFIRDGKVSLNNDDLIFGQSYEAVQKYLRERLGTDGYVMGIRGRINDATVALLSQLDRGLKGDKVVVEVQVKDDEILTFDATKLDDVTQILMYGLPDEMAFDQLDASQPEEGHKGVLEVICTSKLRKSGDVRVTALDRDIDFDVEGITFVRTGKRGAR